MEPEQQDRLLDRLATEITASRPKSPKVDREVVAPAPERSALQPSPAGARGQRRAREPRDPPEGAADEFPAVEAERLTVRAYPYGRLPPTSSATSARSATTSGSTSATTTSSQALRAGRLDRQGGRRGDLRDRAAGHARAHRLRGRRPRTVRCASYEPAHRARARRRRLPRASTPRCRCKTEEALQASLIRAQGPRTSTATARTPRPAAMVVLDPPNGQVLAMASYPNYDPSTCRRHQQRRVEGRSTTRRRQAADQPGDPGRVPGGSTFKLVTSYAGLKLGMITPDTNDQRPGLLRHPRLHGRRGPAAAREPRRPRHGRPGASPSPCRATSTSTRSATTSGPGTSRPRSPPTPCSSRSPPSATARRPASTCPARPPAGCPPRTG